MRLRFPRHAIPGSAGHAAAAPPRPVPAAPRPPVPFTRWRYVGFTVSGLLLAATIALLLFRGLALGLDFTGGVLIEARRETPFDVTAIRSNLERVGAGTAVIQLTDAGHTVLVRLQAESGQSADTIRPALGRDAHVVTEESVGPRVSAELLRSGLTACLAAVGSIALYIWLRFEARFGLSAFLTTFHDVTMMLGLYAATGIAFDLTSIAAMLLIAGYSINDTVVVFDRLRETLGRHREMPLAEAIDRAITSTLRRTLMTSGSTVVTSIALLVFGGPVLFGFAAAVTFGIVLGTLSSIFVAAPLLLVLPGRLPARDPDRQRAGP